MARPLRLSWVDDGKGGQDIKPGWYLAIEVNYKNPTPCPRAEIKNASEGWLREMAVMFEALPSQSRYLSGPLSVFALTKDYPWLESCAELSLFGQRPVLEAHIAAAKAHNFHLMRRISGKLSIKSPIKYHFFYPATLEEALGANRQRRRNLELTRVDPDAGMLCQQFTAHNHIKLRLHQNSGDHVVCTEDKRPIAYPPEYFRGLACEVGGHRMFVIDPHYTLFRERAAISAGTTHRPERHQDLIRRLELWLAEHPEQRPHAVAHRHCRPVPVRALRPALVAEPAHLPTA